MSHCMLAAALLLLPESPRWLVVNGQLDAALAVMRQLYSSGILPAGTEANTAKVRIGSRALLPYGMVRGSQWTLLQLQLRNHQPRLLLATHLLASVQRDACVDCRSSRSCLSCGAPSRRRKQPRASAPMWRGERAKPSCGASAATKRHVLLLVP